jgi:uncharacterized Zn finger protein
MAQKFAALAPFRSLTWEDLETWAGSKTVERGRAYWHGGQVRALARTREGRIVAWVQGDERYATRVERQEGRLASACTCPIGWACKHAVAVILECLDHMAEDRSIPLADPKDPRLELLKDKEPARKATGETARKTRRTASAETKSRQRPAAARAGR